MRAIIVALVILANPIVEIDTGQPDLKVDSGSADLVISPAYKDLELYLPLTSAYKASATVANDLGPHVTTATAYGTPPTFGVNGVSLNGTNDYLETADADHLSFGDGTSDEPMTIFAWVNLTDVTTCIIAGKGEFGVDGEFGFYFDGLDRLNSWLIDHSVGSACFIGARSTAFYTSAQGAWHSVALTYDGGGYAGGVFDIELYFDGVAISSTRIGGAAQASYVAMENLTGGFLVSNDGDGGFFCTGTIAYVGLWRREWSADEILHRHNQGRHP